MPLALESPFLLFPASAKEGRGRIFWGFLERSAERTASPQPRRANEATMSHVVFHTRKKEGDESICVTFFDANQKAQTWTNDHGGPVRHLKVGYSYGGSAKRHVELSRSVKLRMRVHDLAWASPTRQPRRGGIGRRYVSQGTHEHIWYPHTRSYPAHTRPYRSRICARAHAHWAKTPVQLEKTYLAK